MKKSKTHTWRLWAAAALVTFLTQSVAYAASEKSMGDTGGTVDAWVESWNKHDAGALAKLLTPDVDFVLVTGVALKGPADFERVHSGQFSGRYNRSVFAADGAPSISFLRSDIALVQWRWTISGIYEADGSLAPTYHGIFTWVETRSAGTWKIRAAQNTIDR